jgi:acyl-coenzyme A synthetase/AMP-(fatty) acid ligase
MIEAWQNISDAIFHFAEARPEAPAVIDGGRTLTYREFAALVGAAARYLRNTGIAIDDRVGIVLPNCADHLVVSFALMRIGAIPAEIAYGTPTPSIAEMVQRFGLRAIVVESDAQGVNAPLRLVVDAMWRRRLPMTGGDLRIARSADENRLLVLSSGSTGKPKAAIATHRHHMLRARTYFEMLSKHWSEQRPGVFLLTATIANAGFHRFMINQILLGGPVVVLPTFARETDLIRSIASFDNAVSLVTPNMCRAFLKAHTGRDLLLPGMQAMITVGLPLFAHEKRGIVKRITPNFYEVYGSSGFGMIAGLRPEDMKAKAETVGRPVPGATVEIVDSAGRPLPAGAVGRVRCRGETAANSLLATDGTAAGGEGFHDGWYYPGDIAVLDEEGYVHLKGRVSDLIVQGSEEIYPPEIEAAILSLPAVREVAVVGGPPGSNDEAVVACVVRQGELRHEDLVLHCRSRLSPGKLPRRILYVDALPKTPGGKVDRPAVKALAAQRAAGMPSD